MTERTTSNLRRDGQVVSLESHPKLSRRSALEDAYRENRAALISFLQFRLGSPAEAEDIAQAAFTQLWSRRDSLDDRNLTSLLFITARNLATDALRRRKRSPIAPWCGAEYGPDGEAIADDYPSAERALIARRDVSMLQQLLDELPPKCREAFISYKFRSQEYAEIAQAMGVTSSMVRKYVRRAVTHCVSRFSELDAWE
jgi:RNA polymerase sigma factor (sigma-70 family)